MADNEKKGPAAEDGIAKTRAILTEKDGVLEGEPGELAGTAGETPSPGDDAGKRPGGGDAEGAAGGGGPRKG